MQTQDSGHPQERHIIGGAVRYCGREFQVAEVEAIRRIITDHPNAGRTALSRMVCEELEWRRPNGGLKDMSCRVAMLRMQDDGLIRLPASQRRNVGSNPRRPRRTPQGEPEPLCQVPAGALTDLHLEVVTGTKMSPLWSEYMDRYHYLGYRAMAGAQLRYFARAQGRIVGLLGFGASAWRLGDRDWFIGWTDEQRESRLQLVVNNARFLILPWIRSRNLASKLLGMATRRLARDWDVRYAYRPVLVETFVEATRFRATRYKAANWIWVGETWGRGKLDVHNRAALPVKSVWVYPLDKNFRRILCGQS
ncbi:MAG: DUF4338 domain-containing protein [Phycisphaerae bacterium]